ncbi:L,D-transpeptidase [Candidatus Poribacteria bacterium]|nr:L,D-transpeptidase [Candidatus Poribacteria bacterium]
MSNDMEMSSQILQTPLSNPLDIDEGTGGETAGSSNHSVSIFVRLAWLFGLCLGLVFATTILFAAPILREEAFGLLTQSNEVSTLAPEQLRQETQQLEEQVAILREQLKGLIPQEPYLIVDSSDNVIFLKSGETILHQGVCSTGSYIHLKASNSREWVFATPRGMFSIKKKQEAPIWKKPDWAFIEEGLPVPSPNAPERFEAGVLGEYALAIGDGYLIHGTLYKRLLGKPVTHGCVRLNDEELRVVYQNLEVGSKVLIY